MKEKIFSFNIFSFLIAFYFVMLYLYLNFPKPKVIIKYPTPYNTNRLTYMGLTGECYKFKVEQVDCTEDAYKQPIV